MMMLSCTYKLPRLVTRLCLQAWQLQVPFIYLGT